MVVRIRRGGSCQVLLQVVDLLHLLEQLLLTVLLAFQPFPAQDFAAGDGFTEGEGVDEAVFQGAGAHADAGKVVSVVFLAEVPELVGDVKVL